jgi:hypothetical protein
MKFPATRKASKTLSIVPEESESQDISLHSISGGLSDHHSSDLNTRSRTANLNLTPHEDASALEPTLTNQSPQDGATISSFRMSSNPSRRNREIRRRLIAVVMVVLVIAIIIAVIIGIALGNITRRSK